MMQNSPWQNDNYLDPLTTPVTDKKHSRSSLGQFIERSTSAPPPSSIPPDLKFSSGSLVGNDFFEYVTKGYGEMSVNSTTATSTVDAEHQRSASAVNSGFGSALLGRDEDHSGGATAPSTYLQRDFMKQTNGGTVARPLSASGGDAIYGDFLGNQKSAGLVRSQSAAPNLHSGAVAPPPGLNLHAVQSDSFGGVGLHRPASAGVLGGGGSGAVRPAAKTLMDLIQEDNPPEQDPRSSVGSSPAAVNTASSPYDLSGRRSSSPAIVQVRDLGDSGAPSSLQIQLQREQQQQYAQPGGGIPRYQQSSPQVATSPIFEQQQQVTMMRSQQQSQQQRQQFVVSGPGFRQGSPEDAVQQANMYAVQQNLPQHHQVHVQTGQQFQPQHQQILYGGQRVGLQTGGLQPQGMQAHGLHTQGLHAQGLQSQGLQAQVLPNGQTVYVQTQQAYGGPYTTVQYHSPHHQQPQIIHQTLPGGQGQGEQYVSVVPLQGGGQQVTYWQPNGISQQQTIDPATGILSSGHGSAQVVVNTLGNGQNLVDSSVSSPYGGRPRDKGGRGRRVTNVRGRGGDKSSSPSVSSPLLEEFRSTKSRDWTIRRIEGHVVEFCQDQNGSRFIQQRLEMGDISEQQIVMKEVLPAIRRLRNDVFGNYVVQKLLDFGTPSMKSTIRDTLEGEMLQLSLQMYGCRVVQKALEALDEDDLPRLLMEFHHNVLSCIHDQNGNHVVQKCIEVLNSRANKAAQVGDTHRASFLSEQIDFIVDDVLVNAATLSCHPYGCRVLQRILEHCNEQKRTAILDEVKKCHKKLLDDQYGNYVIQHVLQFGREEDRDSILAIIVEGGLLGLSRQKFASNVVEKLLKYGNSNQRRAVVREMLKSADDPTMPSEPGDGHSSVVLLMVRDAYANYVVQTTLDVVPDSEEKRLLLEELNSHCDDLRNYTFAKHIVAKLSCLNNGN